MKRKLIIFIVAALVIAGGFFLMKSKERSIAALPKPTLVTPVVQVALVVDGMVEELGHYLGLVEPVSKSDLSARITGNILTINKREGDMVRQGEVVVTVDDRELMERSAAIQSEVMASQQRLIGAQSSYATQQSIYTRDEKLYSAGAISQEALERSKAALDGTKATVDAYQASIKGLTMSTSAARTQASYARIVAPFTGIITKRWMEPGDLAVPGKPILTIEKTSPYKVTIQMPQEELAGVSAGSKLYLKNGDQVIIANISRVYPALGRNLLTTVESILPVAPFNLPSGSSLSVDLVSKGITGLIVPENAVVKSPKGAFVCVVKEGTIQIRPVKLLGSGSGKVAIVGELVAGEQVAFGQENRLLTFSEGTKVAVAGGSK
jgi:RND family efflux transporter MFP subunit